MFNHTITERLNAVRSAVSSESLTALYSRNIPLPKRGEPLTSAYLAEERSRVRVREAIANHLLCGVKLLSLLASDPASSVRRVVAGVCAVGAVLNRLASDICSEVKLALINNLSTPAYLLRVLTADSDPIVRLSAEKLLTPVSTASSFEFGSTISYPHHGGDTRFIIAGRPATTEGVVRMEQVALVA